MAVNRTRNSIGKHETVTSPVDPETTFTIKRAGNYEDIERKNFFSKVRFLDPSSSDGFVSERDFPMGDLELLTVSLCLVGWNLCEDDAPVPVNKKNILDYTLPKERIFLYDEIIKLNQDLWGAQQPVSDEGKNA